MEDPARGPVHGNRARGTVGVSQRLVTFGASTFASSGKARARLFAWIPRSLFGAIGYQLSTLLGANGRLQICKADGLDVALDPAGRLLCLRGPSTCGALDR